jgi:hypothetical protein
VLPNGVVWLRLEAALRYQLFEQIVFFPVAKVADVAGASETRMNYE